MPINEFVVQISVNPIRIYDFVRNILWGGGRHEVVAGFGDAISNIKHYQYLNWTYYDMINKQVNLLLLGDRSAICYGY